MKKSLLIWTNAFHAIMYSISLLYIGYEYGEGSLLLHPRGLEYFIFPAIDVILLIIGLSLLHNREYVKSKSYLRMGIVTLILGIWKLGSRLFFYYQGMMDGTSEYLDFFVYPGIAFCLYIIISIFYFVCASITFKEDQMLLKLLQYSVTKAEDSID